MFSNAETELNKSVAYKKEPVVDFQFSENSQEIVYPRFR